ATLGALQLLLAQGFEARVARLPEGEDPDDFLRREGPEELARRIDEAPDFLTWAIDDVRPGAEGLSAAEKRERIARLQQILAAIPDRVLRYEEYRKLSRAVAVPLEVLWEGEKANRRPEITRSSSVGTPGNKPVLSAEEAPAVERRLLRFLTAGGEHNSLILRALQDNYLTDPRVRRVVAVLRKAGEGPEPVDFQGQIADLTEDERTFLSGIALDESPEPTEKGVDQLLKALETNYLKTESSALQQAIQRAEGEESGIDELLRKKEQVDRRIAQLNRKG
ncbi:MAG TPA: hypothetical protein VKG23_13225, partial [Thermoanaerobaculia bacterium]|nr:hypothetical protein [Thermoanaerobaculia bacterium]